jgi:ribonuclease G
MSKELVISANRHETRVAMIEDDQVVEIFHQRENEYSLAGSIHKGRVTRVLPGMQSAFVDIGLDRDAFLYVSDFFEDNEEYDKIVTGVEEKVLKLDRTGGRRSRRRRGQRGGRGLPDSKFYSPGHHATETAPPAEPRTLEPAQPVAPAREDMLVLPGESLAKYTGPARMVEDSEPATTEESAGEEHQFEPEVPAAAAVASAVPVDDPPPAAPVDEKSAAAAPSKAEVVISEPAEAPIEAAEVADELTEAPQSAAVPDSTEAGAELESASEGEDLAECEDAPEGEGIAESQAAAEDQVSEGGTEPPPPNGSLTATQREQGPRYQHRVSRRTRRRGGRDRNPAPGEAPRPQEARPEQRTVAAPRASEGRPEKGASASIADLLRAGQEIIVQIAKEPLGQKGARITSHIALPGRFLVYMPTVDHIGVSRKIPSDEERSRLKRVLQANRSGIPGGFIVRTAGDGRSEEELRADMHFLYNMWLDMRQKAERKPAPLLIHHDLNVVERVLRDQLTGEFKSIWVDNEEAYESVLRFVERFQPALVSRVKLYSRSNPIFDEFGITAELEKALRPKVWLKSGGHIVINQTEALVAIDVNTGKFVGKSNRLEDTIVKTNTDAIREIVRQIRLRDLGGIIVVDFIDMDERKNRQKVMQTLEDAMRADRAPYKILQFNDFGLVAITRKRVKQSLERTLCTPCPYCEGAGYVKSPQTVVGEILGEAQKIAATLEGKDVMLRVSPDVAKLLKSNQNTYLQELEEVLGRTVIIKSDPQLHQEKFDLA